jgi:hypothetical protein
MISAFQEEKMKPLYKMVALIVMTAFIMGPVWAPAQEWTDAVEPRTAEKMVVDALVVRPLGILGTVAGTLVFVVSLPFSALGGNTDSAFQKLVAEPAAYTFKRPLGDI